MTERKVLIVGCGDIGIVLSRHLIQQGAKVWGLRRDCSLLPASIQGIAADVTKPDSLQGLKGQHFDTVVFTLTPGEFSDQRYRDIFVDGLSNVLAVLRAAQVIFVSSSSVYHQGDEQWVDEESPTFPKSFSGKRLLEAEALLAAQATPATVVRFAGIYGLGRRRLIQQVLAGEGSPPIYSNRIHRDDCVGFLAHLIALQWRGNVLQTCYLGVDSEPVKLSELKTWLAEQLGVDPGCLLTETVSRRSSKRCSNRRMLATGYKLLYPGFRQGYQTVIDAEPIEKNK